MWTSVTVIFLVAGTILSMQILLVQNSNSGGHFRMKDAAPTLNMVVSYWGYVAFLPTMIVAFIYLGFIRRKD